MHGADSLLGLLELEPGCLPTHQHVAAEASHRMKPSVPAEERLNVNMPTFSVMYKGAVIISR